MKETVFNLLLPFSSCVFPCACPFPYPFHAAPFPDKTQIINQNFNQDSEIIHDYDIHGFYTSPNQEIILKTRRIL